MFENKVRVICISDTDNSIDGKEGYILRPNGIKYDVCIPENNETYSLYRENFVLVTETNRGLYGQN